MENVYKIGTVVGHPDGDDLLVRARNGIVFDLRLAEVYAKELKQKGGPEAKRLLMSILPKGTHIKYLIVGSNFGRKVCKVKIGGRLFNSTYNTELKRKGLYGGNGID